MASWIAYGIIGFFACLIWGYARDHDPEGKGDPEPLVDPRRKGPFGFSLPRDDDGY